MRASLVVLGVLIGTPLHASAKSKLAVMPITDGTRTLSATLLDSLTDALRARLALTGRYFVIDKSRQAEALRKLVKQQKAESYKACYDNKCQIPLGQALAADTILRTKLTRVGSTYVLNAELVDLAKEAVTGAAQANTPVNPRGTRDDRLLRATVNLAWQLDRAEATPVPVPAPSPAPEPQPEPRRVQPEPRAAPLDPVEVERRREARQRQLEAQQRQAALNAASQEDEQVRRRRVMFQLYGWGGIISGAILTGAGVYYFLGKAAQARTRANEATSPSEVDGASQEVSSARTTGGVFLGLGIASAGVGVLFLLLAPKVQQRPVSVGRFELDRFPATTIAAGRSGLTWGGRF